jgi:hypothetical protein
MSRQAFAKLVRSCVVALLEADLGFEREESSEKEYSTESYA